MQPQGSGDYDYNQHKNVAQSGGFNQHEGINVLVFDDNHDPLKDLQIQKKKKFFPTMADTSTEFHNIHFPASTYNKQSRDVGAAVPLSGNWALEKQEVSDMGPAGQRIPKDFKKNLAEKIPIMMEQLKSQGLNEEEITRAILEKRAQSIEKYGNKSKIGLLLEQENKDLVRSSHFLDREFGVRKEQTRNASDFNRALMQKGELQKMRDQFKQVAQSADKPISGVGSRASSHVTESVWSTTNQQFYQPKEIRDLKTMRKNFKKRTPFTQWSNAYFGNGVFFNPPVTGI